MYAKSLLVVALCTIFVLAFALVLNYEASSVGTGATTVPASQTACAATGAPCESLAVTSATLRTVNYTDELGTVTYSNLSVGFTPAGPSPLASVNLYFGNATSTTKVFTAQGPFQTGVNRVLTLTLPSSIAVYPGKTYLVSVEGYLGGSLEATATAEVTAQ